MIGLTSFLSVSLVLPFLCHFFISPASAFTTSFPTSSTQCGSFTITWSQDANQSLGPPFNISIVPVNSPTAPNAYSAGLGPDGLSVPILVEVPGSAFDATTNKGSHTIEKLPLRAGERFIVAMDDGYGLGTGGVSTIQTVATSPTSDSSCFSSASNSDNSFTISDLTPVPCQQVSITTGPTKQIRGFVPGGTAFALDVTNSAASSVVTEWTMNIAASTSFVLVYESLDSATVRTSGLITVGTDGVLGNSCLDTISPHSTISAPNPESTVGGIASANSSTSTSSGHKKTNIAAIVGGILGGLTFIAVVTLLIFFCIYRRTDTLGRSRSLTTVTPYRSGNSRATGTTGSGDDKSKRSGNKEGPRSEGLEGRLGTSLFGGGGKRKKGKRGEEWNTGMTSSRKRAMYPGLSFASTQNQSIVEDVEEDGRRQRARDGRATPPPVPFYAGAGVGRELDGDPAVSRWQDSKRRDGRIDRPATTTETTRRDSATQSSFVSGITSTGIQRPVDQYTVGGGLSDIVESDARHEGDQSMISSSPTRQLSLHESRSTLLTTALNSATVDTPSDSKTRSTTRKDGSSRPSTAPLTREHRGDSPSAGGGVDAASSKTPASRGYHLPSRAMRSSSVDLEHESSMAHVYPPDQKESHPVERTRRMEEAGEDWRSDGSHHPYALAMSPHDDIPGPFSNRTGGRDRGPSISHPYSDPVNTTSGSYQSLGSQHSNSQRQQRRPGGGGNHGSQPHIIRHRDAGLMMGSEDGDDHEERMIVELPPSYGEVASSGRRLR
ncbi:hypothetical protein FRB91_009450 [Serendipita sp. 411]|nr:hypothetical protein FRB91_009450 [Serendipita sp. 411]